MNNKLRNTKIIQSSVEIKEITFFDSFRFWTSGFG